jgi:hypothetical protein
MKTIKSAILGSKTVESDNPELQLMWMKEMLADHRNLLIARLLNDLPTYVRYKFNVKPTKEQLDGIHEKLLYLKSKSIELAHYESLVQQVRTRAVTYLTSEPFYLEIDAVIDAQLKSGQLEMRAG